jgi:diadenosine tetraphosphate (Ap4A) HIT family hydrolase
VAVTEPTDGVDDWRADRVGAAERGENPTVLARLHTGWAVIGDTQHLPGYCLLLYQDPAVDQLIELPRREWAAFLFDVALLGEAVHTACTRLDPALDRVNYEVLGNTLHQLHAHVLPRYRWEPTHLRRGPVWHHPDRDHPAHALGPQHDPLRTAITSELSRITAEAYP